MIFVRQYSLWIILICAIVILGQPTKNIPRKYIVRRDFFKLLKSAQFSAMDEDEQQTYFRIESYYHILQRVDIIRYPEKKKTGELASQFHLFTYRGNFTIFEGKSKKWIEGQIEEHFRILTKFFMVRWNGHQFNVTNSLTDRGYHFRNENNTLLADFSLRFLSQLWRKKYDLKIYTNDYPDELYLLTIAAIDRRLSIKRKE